MLRIIEANETEELSELRTVLQKTQLCDAVATLKQFLTLRDGTMNNVEVKQETTPVETTVFLDDNLVRVTLKATIDKSKDILRLRSMWDIALQRGTQKALEGKPNDYAVVLDLVKPELEDSRVYVLSFFRPLFMSTEEDELVLLFDASSAYFGIEEMTLGEVEYEEELLARDEPDSRDAGVADDYDDEVGDSEENEDVIGNDQFLHL